MRCMPRWAEPVSPAVNLFYRTPLPRLMVRFAKRVTSIESSPTVRLGDLVTEMKARGDKVLSLSVGEPDFPTPAHIVEAGKKALDDGFTKYTPSVGLKELREAIAEKSVRENKIPAKTENVLVSPTKHTLYMACMALLDAGDEAIIPDPGWVSYGPMIVLAGPKPVPGFFPSETPSRPMSARDAPPGRWLRVM